METATIQPPKDHAEKVERLRLVLRTIEANPQHWNQNSWHCRTSHCFAGFAQMIARGISLDSEADFIDSFGARADEDAIAWLGINDFHGSLLEGGLFDPNNTLDDLRRIVNEIAESPAAHARGEQITTT